MDNQKKMEWFRQARYGLFIHWGLYAIPAGDWKGERCPHGTEWIMKNLKIPLAEYSRLAEKFNPEKFDADEWVRMARDDFGMKYICFTTKHHDGFAMYDSCVSDYKITNTPFQRDVFKEISRACEKYGVMLCAYYSQYQDWEDPDGFGNDWDRESESSGDFRYYFDHKVKPQLREILTGYGKIGMLWFDTPYEMPKALCQELVDFVHELAPDCLINGRVGYGLGDYRQMGDNGIPVVAYRGDWETPMTLNDTWGYRHDDFNWKSPVTVMRMLVDIVGKGGNFLLNVGPDALGVIPQGSVNILKTIGAWLKNNGEAIYGCGASPDFPYQLPWGGFTYNAEKNTLYMHVLKYPNVDPYEICVVGLETRVQSAKLLATGEPVRFRQTYETARNEHRLRVWLPPVQPDELNTVVELKLEAPCEVQDLYSHN